MSGYSSLHAPHALPRRKGAAIDALLFILAMGMLGATAFTTRLHAPVSVGAAKLEHSAR